MYDYFKGQLGIEPPIVDSEDYIYRTTAVMGKLCERYGLDPDGVRYTCDSVPEEYWWQGSLWDMSWAARGSREEIR